VLDAISHRPDVPVLPHGPYVGLGLWNSVPATLFVEISMYFAGIALYLRATRGRAHRAFGVLTAVLFLLYLASALGPPPPSVAAIAWSGVLGWLLVPCAWWADTTTTRKW
jgi:hypothetical protein